LAPEVESVIVVVCIEVNVPPEGEIIGVAAAGFELTVKIPTGNALGLVLTPTFMECVPLKAGKKLRLKVNVILLPFTTNELPWP